MTSFSTSVSILARLPRQVNSSPDMSSTTPVTSRLCPAALAGLVPVLLGEPGPPPGSGWRCVHRGVEATVDGAAAAAAAELQARGGGGGEMLERREGGVGKRRGGAGIGQVREKTGKMPCGGCSRWPLG